MSAPATIRRRRIRSTLATLLTIGLCFSTGCGANPTGIALSLLGNVPGVGLARNIVTSIPGIDLLGGLAGGLGGSGLLGGGGILGGGGLLGGGPAGFILSIASSLLRPPPNPLEYEIAASSTPTSDGKIYVDVPLPVQIEPLVLAQLPAAANYAARGPDGRIYYTEKDTGRVRIFDPAASAVLDTVVLDLPVNTSGTRGLKGITFSTDGGTLYLTYDRSITDEDTATEPEALDARLVSFAFAGGAVVGPETMLFATAPRDPMFASDINGIGPCVVAPDGFLYFCHGDRNQRFSAVNFSTDDPSGRILRINQDGGLPDGNAPPGSPVFASGFRAPTSLAFDPATGLFFIADWGSNVSDEINLGEVGIAYGWPFIQGLPNADLEDAFAETFLFLYRNPILDFGQSKYDPRGMVVLRSHPYGSAVEGDLLVGQSSTLPSIVHRYRISTDLFLQHSVVFEVPATGGRIRDMVQGPDGRVFIFCTNEVFVLNPVAAE